MLELAVIPLILLHPTITNDKHFYISISSLISQLMHSLIDKLSTVDGISIKEMKQVKMEYPPLQYSPHD